VRELPDGARDYVLSLPPRRLSPGAVRALVWQLGLGGGRACDVRRGRLPGLVHVLVPPVRGRAAPGPGAAPREDAPG
jgi:hypothetical protein